ncbi:MAG: MFS transporter [Deltaproteobacteria bacterium]|nr:MFS transporter [Deltaproteobacteria bacterium]
MPPRRTYRQAVSTPARIGWVMYDWADSAFALGIITVLGPAFFLGVFHKAATPEGLSVGGATAMNLGGVSVTGEAAWAFLISLSALVVAVSSPFLGALADLGGYKRRLLGLFFLSGAAATAAVALGVSWWWTGLCMLLANIGYEGAHVYYNGFLAEMASEEDRPLLSSAGFSLGYLGGMVALLGALAWFVPPHGDIHHAFLWIGAWWGGFGLITLLLVRDAAVQGRAHSWGNQLKTARQELVRTLKGLRNHPQALWFLGAFLLYNDGITTLITAITPFALQNLYVDEARTLHPQVKDLIPAILLSQIVAIPGSLATGWLASRWGEKASLYLCLAILCFVLFYGQVIQTMRELMVMAGLVGLVLGGSQAISRSLYASFIPPGRSAEFFSFYALSHKVSSVFGPLLYGVILLFTGQTRTALLGMCVLFVAGGVLLWRVDVPLGRAQREV